jgi:hypothetical protein
MNIEEFCEELRTVDGPWHIKYLEGPSQRIRNPNNLCPIEAMMVHKGFPGSLVGCHKVLQIDNDTFDKITDAADFSDTPHQELRQKFLDILIK